MHMKRMNWWRLALAIALGCTGVSSGKEITPQEAYRENSLKAFAEHAKAHPLPSGGILMLGSSTMSIWAKQPGLTAREPFIWHGLSGTTYGFLVDNLDRLLLDYKPSRVIVYSGDNDLGDGRGGEAAAQRVAGHARTLAEQLRARVPGVRMTFIAIKKSIKRASAEPVQRQANELLKTLADEAEDVDYLDFSGLLLGPDGQPDPACFSPDGLHISKLGYERWSKALSTYLQE